MGKKMKLRKIYDNAVQTAILNDPRGETAVNKELKELNKQYKELKPKDKKYFDNESLTNPYADSRILHGSENKDIRKVMVGIDIEGDEILLADRLNEKGTGIDLIIAHHPKGKGITGLSDVMYMQTEILHTLGIPINVAESILAKRISTVEKNLMPMNHNRFVDIAKQLNIPLMCLHSPADNMVATYLQKIFDKEKPYKLSDITDRLLEEPEYQYAKHLGAGPKVVVGSEKRKAGKIFVDMTGGTNGSKEMFQFFAANNISTVVGMHFTEEHRNEADKNHVNIVIAGHIASDNLGLNLLFDAILPNKLEITECSGYKRYLRVK
jgi:putative NIF3 family GTP cyclohydrolase 1 type 2